MNSNLGFSLLELILTSGITVITLLALSQLILQNLRDYHTSIANSTVLDTRAQLLGLLQDPDSVAMTIEKNPAVFACLTSSSMACPANPQFVPRLYDRFANATHIPVDPAEPNTGLDLNGAVCEGFNVNGACPFQIRVSWQKICGTPCSQPLIKWDVDFQSNFSNQDPLRVIQTKSFQVYSPYGGPRGRVADLTVGIWDACAVMQVTGEVYCWGREENGNLGNPNIGVKTLTPQIVLMKGTNQPLKNATAVHNGNDTNCALLQSKEVVCWGENNGGSLGRGPIPVTPPPAPPPPAAALVLNQDNRADYVRDFTNTGNLDKVTRLVGGENGYCAEREGRIVCWGRNEFHRTETPNRLAPLYYDEPNRSYGLPSEIQPIATTSMPANIFRFDTLSFAHCFLLTDGEASCYGRELFGAFGRNPSLAPIDVPMNQNNRLVKPDGTPIQNIAQLEVGKYFMCVLSDGRVLCAGLNHNLANETVGGNPPPLNLNYRLGRVTAEIGGNYGEVVKEDGTPLTDIVQISLHGRGGCARSAGGEAYCWGENLKGRTGHLATVGGATPFANKILIPSASSVQKVMSGVEHACALMVDANVYCWGSNDEGRLGNNSEVASLVPILVEFD